MKPVYRNLIFLCLFFIATIVAWYAFDLKSYVNTATIREHHMFLCDTIAQRPIASACTYIAIFIALTVTPLPVTLMLMSTSGFLFGVVQGSLYSFCALMISTRITFYASRHMFGVYLQRKYAQRLHKFNQACSRYGFYYLLVVRAIPLLPFFFVNMCAGLTTIKSNIFTLTTALGIIPAILFCSYLGSQCVSLIVY